MKVLVMAVRDKRTEFFLTPTMFVRAKGEGIRWFMDVMSNPEHSFSKHPGDFDLYVLAEFDDNSGVFTCDASLPMQVISGLELKASATQN